MMLVAWVVGKDQKDQEGHKVGLEEKDLQEEDQEVHKVDQVEKDLKDQEGLKMGLEAKDLLVKDLEEKVEEKALLVKGLVDQTVLGLKLLEKGASVCLM